MRAIAKNAMNRMTEQWFAYVCIVLAPLPALYDGWRAYNQFKSENRN